MPKLKYFSLFTGIGGLDYGMEKRGFECVGFSDIKETSIKVYQKHFPDHVPFGDVTEIEPEKMPDFDILTGGFPCQSFSLAGLRKGLKDKKGGKGEMIFVIYNMLIVKKPKFAVLENVKGLLNHDGGRTFLKVVKLMEMAGYHTNVLLLNAAHYGSAQSRERLIFLCSREKFEKKIPVVTDATKRFRDIRDDDESKYKLISKGEGNRKRLFDNVNYGFEVIGGYDRVGTLLTTTYCGKKAVPHGDWFRMLTPLECERLQGFDDGYTEGISDNNRYFALGNAVNRNMSDYIFNNYLAGLWWN